MSEVDQLAAAAARRAPAAAEPIAAPAVAPARRRMENRTPFGGFEQKLSYPARPGYHRHWFNDDPGRIVRAEQAGYAKVVDATTGVPVSKVVGVARGGGPLTAHLMEIPEEWYAEDQAAQESEYRSRIASIKEGRPPGGPSGADAAAQYVGKQGIKITEGRR